MAKQTSAVAQMVQPEGGSTFIKYIGNGDYVMGIPARNLTTEEWETLPETTRQALLEQKLYELTDASASEPMSEPATTLSVSPTSA